MEPLGGYLTEPGEIELCPGRIRKNVVVTNSGDRPVQIGSHYHFFEVNSSLGFDRDEAKGMRLDIPAGTAVRFEPGMTQRVTLVAFGGSRKVYGFRDFVNGPVDLEGKERRDEAP